MKIKELRDIFKNRLSDLYTESESIFIFSAFINKFLNYDKIKQKIFENETIDEGVVRRFHQILLDLEKGKPYQYILGEVEFFGHIFKVNENVLIPRPETEELLELAISQIKKKFNSNKISILEVGSGSGIISIILKKYFPNAEITSFDISRKAIETARENAQIHQVEIDFVEKDYLNHHFINEKFDVIISNPPYIGIEESVEISDLVKNFEPNIALFSPTEDTLIFYRKIAKDAEQIFNENGMIFLEINQKLGRETLDLYQKFNAELIKDLSGNDRFIFVSN